jgi:DNA helicase-2/ATP-dependent DNA helicase PcrA
VTETEPAVEIEDVLAQRLTEAQRAAARDPSAEVLAIACAGSGKSRTLAFRIARLIADGAEPRGIVAFTFTEKAAESIKLQVARSLDAVGIDPTIVGAMYVGTIHSYCKDLLAAMDATYRQFEVLDDNRLTLYLISRYPQLGISALKTARSAKYFNTLKEVAEAWKVANDELLDLDAIAEADPGLGAVLHEIGAGLERDQFIDFSLMIRCVVEALQRHDPSAESAVADLEHLLVDEYQDVNAGQERLVEELHRRGATLFVAGDDDQAIFGFRGSDVSNILGFDGHYAGCVRHTLAHNFRSTEAIVQTADEFAAAELGATRLTKNPTADTPDGPRDYRVLWFPEREEEAEWVASRIEALLGTAYTERDGTVRGLTPADFAILMRSTRMEEQGGGPRHAAFTDALERARGGQGIPFSLEAAGGIFDRPHVAVLRDTFELLRGASPSREVARAHFDENVVPLFPRARFDEFARVLAEWGRLIHSPTSGGPRRRVYPQRLLQDILSAFALPETDLDDGMMHDIGVFSRILQDVESVYMSIDSARRYADILNFLGNTATNGYDSATDDLLRRPDAVTVATVHKVKGLEYPVVFIVDAEAQRFPKNNRRYSGWLPEALLQMPLSRGAYQTTRAEEARLFYTAMTRAERYLYITACASLPGGRRPRLPSPFTQRLSHPEISADPSGLPAGLVPHEQRRRIDETIVPTTYSEIRYYLRCPRDFQFRKSFGFSPPITEMFGFGSTIHAAVGKLHEQFASATPSEDDAEQIARQVFHLKHVPESRDPVNRPGAYENGRDSAARILRQYAKDYSDDFAHERQVEVRFEVPVTRAVISGTIDLLLRYDKDDNLLDASVVDFKTMEGGPDPTDNEALDWTELALQVQLYAKAAREVLGENAKTGAVHLLKDGQRVAVPVDDAAIEAAVANVEWAVNRILDDDFPMRPHPDKCDECDFQAICAQRPQAFRVDDQPPPIHLPEPLEPRLARAFSQADEP